MKRILFAALVVFMAGASITAIAAGVGRDAPPDNGAEHVTPGAPDARPADEPRLSARAARPDGKEVGLVTYRNREGRLCVVEGPLRDGELERRGNTPYEQLGNCTVRPEPVAVSVTSIGDDPQTAEDERGTIVSGVARAGIASVAVTAGQRTQTARPGRNGAFIFAMPTLSPDGSGVVVTTTSDAGDRQTLRMPAPADPQAILEGAEKNAPR